MNANSLLEAPSFRMGRPQFTVCGYPKERDETNSITFPWKGYMLTSVGKNEISYDETIHILNIKSGMEMVYAIKLEGAVQ